MSVSHAAGDGEDNWDFKDMLRAFEAAMSNIVQYWVTSGDWSALSAS